MTPKPPNTELHQPFKTYKRSTRQPSPEEEEPLTKKPNLEPKFEAEKPENIDEVKKSKKKLSKICEIPLEWTPAISFQAPKDPRNPRQKSEPIKIRLLHWENIGSNMVIIKRKWSPELKPFSPENEETQNPEDINDDGEYYSAFSGPDTLEEFYEVQKLMDQYVWRKPFDEESRNRAKLKFEQRQLFKEDLENAQNGLAVPTRLFTARSRVNAHTLSIT